MFKSFLDYIIVKPNFRKLNILKFSFTSLAVINFMSATQCAQQEVAQKRELKKNIRVMQMSASNFLDNSGFSFSETAQSQLSGVLFEKNYFFERSIYPTDRSAVRKQNEFRLNKLSLEQAKKLIPTLKEQDILLSNDSSCMMSRPQHFIAGKINALEAYSGASLQFGFNQTVAPVIPVSANLKLDKMRMDLSFHSFDPWTQQVVASVNSSAMKNDYKAGFGIDLGIIHIGPEFYRITGLAEVTLKGIQNGIQDLAKKLLSLPGQDWSSRIIYNQDSKVLILGGQELGIKKGDQFKVYNQVFNWIGEPCGESSVLNGATVTSDTKDPWIIEIEDAGDLMSTAKLLNPKENISISVGALVKLHQLVEDIPVPASKEAP